MKKILITGVNGFIGKNLEVKLKELKKYEITGFDLGNTNEELENFVTNSDVIIHLAGSNRPKDISEYETVNFGLTSQIVEILEKQTGNKNIIFASSTQAELDNEYGKSKLAAESRLINFAKKTNNNVFIYRLSNVFGKWCRPNYNSVVATFCYNIANNLPISINDESAVLKLIYIDDIVSELAKQIEYEGNWNAEKRIEIHPSYESTLGELASKLFSFKESRVSLKLPDVADQFTKKLYSTYLSYLNSNDFGYFLSKKTDNRGDLTELLKSEKFGQFFVSTTKPGVTRGNHYHHTKTEKFIVIKGDAEIKFRKIVEFNPVLQSNETVKSNFDAPDEIITYKVSGNDIKVIEIPPGYTHNITNIGQSDLLTLFWSNEIYNTDRPDTYFLEV